jgi:two-component system, NarL family, nitrate/nitrite response regulator NarL
VDWDAGPERGSTETPAAKVADGRVSVSVLVVDDSPVFRRGMGRAVAIHSGLELVGEADGGEAALEAIDRLSPDVVLLDLRMPGLDGFGVLERLRDADPAPTCRVLIVSASLDEDVEQAARAAGAVGCVSKESPRADICAAALRLARG